MAWEFVRETFGREYELAWDSRSATRVFLCKSDTDITDLKEVVTAYDGSTAIPEINDTYPSDSRMYVRSITPEEIDHEQKLYQVTVEYETVASGSTSPEPEDTPWEISWTTRELSRVLDTSVMDTTTLIGGGWEGQGTVPNIGTSVDEEVLNTARTPYDPPIVIPRYTHICTLSHNYKAFDDIGSLSSLDDLLSYKGKINDDAIQIADYNAVAYELIIADIQVSLEGEEGDEYLHVTWTIIADNWLWIPVVLEQGYDCFPFDGAQKTIKCKSGQEGLEVTSPQRLDVNGLQITNSSDASWYTAWGAYLPADFSALDLPTDMI